jgi:putative toxin-antitoxin system antitoxin component (TIGR02293 family)
MSRVARKPAGKSSQSMVRSTTRTAKRATTVTNFLGKVHSGPIRQQSASAVAFAQSANAARRMDRPTSGTTAKNPITFVRLAALSPEAREQAVTTGLPATLLDEAATKLGLSQRAFLAALKIAPTTVARVKSTGSALSTDDSDRIARLAELWHDAMTVFQHEEGARGWLTGRVPVLDAVPLQLVQTSQGFNRARTAVLQLAYGVYA